MPNPFEESPEKIPSREEVIEIINRYAENGEIVREISDDKGLFLIEVKTPGEKEGEVIEYEYMRKGRMDEKNGGTLMSSIEVVYYQDEIPYHGRTLVNYNDSTGEWEEVLE